VLRGVHRLMVDRQASIAQVLGVTDAWHLGPSPSCPLVIVIDEAHTFFHERKGTSPEVKAHNALVPSRPASVTTARSPSASPPAPWMGRWPPLARRSASIPTPPRSC
jgi:hypothetical protein